MTTLILPASRMRMSRRLLLASVFAGGVAAACSPSNAPAAGTATASTTANGDPIVETTAGKVQGLLDSSSGVRVFKGVPYGASTAPPNRFRAPRAPDPWTGVKETVAYGYSAPQGASTAPVEAREDAPADLADETPRRLLNNSPAGAGPSEDCLVLNVWTPATDGAKRPVMVWLHGGGFSSGSGASTWYDGTRLAQKQDVVVVTINHRLNVFGFLYLGDLGGGEFADSSSVGMLDCVLALQWVKDNIERFGGDPSRVLIHGESGGGRKTSTMMVMPPAQGLFNRCVVQSGSQLRLDGPEIAMQRTEQFFSGVGVTKDDIGALQNLSLDQMLAAVGGATRGTGQFRPVAGAPSTPYHPFDPAAPAISANVPMMIGTNRTEASVFMGNLPGITTLDEAALRTRVAALVPEERASDVIAMYRRLYPQAKNDEILYMTSTDRGYFLDSTIQAERKAAQGGAGCWYYGFYRDTPVEGGRYHAPHAAEIPFVFDNIDKAISMGGQPTPAAQTLADQMSGAWAAFARNGDPNHDGLINWPQYGTDRTAMVFDEPPRVENDIRSEQRQLMLSFGSQQDGRVETGPG